MTSRLISDPSLICIHAHPDDEASKGAATVRKYASLGISTSLVTSTGGERGDILNPELIGKINPDNLHYFRISELIKSASIIGYEKLYTLGYRDSGMPKTLTDSSVNCFYTAEFKKCVKDLVEVIREVKPQVIISYGADQRRYPHPDHIRAHQISLCAYLLSPKKNYHPEIGEPFSPLKLYYSSFSFEKIKKIHETLLKRFGKSPFDERFVAPFRESPEFPSTRIDIKGFVKYAKEALLAHKTQVDPNSPIWFSLSPEEEEELFPFEEYHLAHSRLGICADDFKLEKETDLFYKIL